MIIKRVFSQLDKFQSPYNLVIHFQNNKIKAIGKLRQAHCSRAAPCFVAPHQDAHAVEDPYVSLMEQRQVVVNGTAVRGGVRVN